MKGFLIIDGMKDDKTACLFRGLYDTTDILDVQYYTALTQHWRSQGWRLWFQLHLDVGGTP